MWPGQSIGHGIVIQWSKRDWENKTDGKKSCVSPIPDQSRSTDATSRESAQAHGQPMAAGGVAPNLLRPSLRLLALRACGRLDDRVAIRERESRQNGMPMHFMCNMCANSRQENGRLPCIVHGEWKHMAEGLRRDGQAEHRGHLSAHPGAAKVLHRTAGRECHVHLSHRTRPCPT